MVGGPSKVFQATGGRVKDAIAALVVAHGREGGDLRPDVEPLELLRALWGVSNVALGGDWK